MTVGDKDLSASVSPDILGPNGDNIRIDLAFGYTVRNNTVARLTLLHHIIEDIAPNENDYKSQALGVRLERHFFRNSTWAPYTGLILSTRKTKFNDVSVSAPTYGLILGVNYRLTDTVAFDVNVSYESSTKDVFIVDFESKSEYISPGIGLRVFFR